MNKIIIILSLVLLGSYSYSEETPSDQLQMHIDGLYCEVNSTTLFTGVVADYYDNGQLKQTGNWKDNKSEGLWEYYHSNGQLNGRVKYKDGKEVR